MGTQGVGISEDGGFILPEEYASFVEELKQGAVLIRQSTIEKMHKAQVQESRRLREGLLDVALAIGARDDYFGLWREGFRKIADLLDMTPDALDKQLEPRRDT